jgi:Asp-tRNA(Asn)/Glu-tRNA(Gln) amidotransferase A subunit family amidase
MPSQWSANPCLVDLADALRSGTPPLPTYIEAVCRKLETRERNIQALLPESDRRARLLAESEALLSRFPTTESRPPLFGVLVGVKDVFRADGFPTRAGSVLPAELFVGPEAPVVTRLREAGALILGKTVTTEFAYFEPGLTRNPQDPERTPGGSSSGSAAAVAEGYCRLALGTQTVGSVLRPASFCGVVGFKPTHGLLSTEGVIPYAPSLDHAGFFVPAPEDVPFALATLGIPNSSAAPPARVLALPEGPYLEAASPEMQEQLARWIGWLEPKGWEIRRVPVFNDLETIAERNQWLASAEMAQVHRDWYPKYRDLYRPRTRAQIEAGQAVTPEQEQSAREGQLRLRHELGWLLDEVSACAWICPAAPGVAPRGMATGDPIMNLPWTYAGLPAVSLPMSWWENQLPLGIQLVGRFGGDTDLAALVVALAETPPPWEGE